MAGLQGNHTAQDEAFQRPDVITAVTRRCCWSQSEKARIVAESYAPGASAASMAARYGLHRNLIFAWRRQFGNRAAAVASAVATFVPVAVASPAEIGAGSGAESGPIEVIAGGVTIRVGAGFDSGDLRRVLQIVRELP